MGLKHRGELVAGEFHYIEGLFEAGPQISLANISEYAVFEKPIVAAGYSDCKDFLSASTNVESYSHAIVSAFRGNAPSPTPHFWEENESIIKEAYSLLHE